MELINNNLLDTTGDKWIDVIEGNEAEIIKRCELFPELVVMLEMLTEYCEMYSQEEPIPMFIDGDIKEAKSLLTKVKA